MREDLFKRLKELQEPQLEHLAMLNTAFLQAMDAIERVRDYCNAVMMDGMGVPIEDPRFTARMTAHMILNKLDGEQ